MVREITQKRRLRVKGKANKIGLSAKSALICSVHPCAADDFLREYQLTMMKKKNKSGLVYSTETGRTCPGCGHPVASCCCSSKNKPVGDGNVRISRQTKGRKGAGVSIVSGIPLMEKELKKLAKELKKKCGTGGTVKNGVIEIQGDHRELLLQELKKAGYKAKLAGG